MDRLRLLERVLWVVMLIVVASISGALAGLAAWLLGLTYPIMTGIVTAVLDLAPILGTTLMTFPVFILGLLQSPVVAVIGALVCYRLSHFDSNVLSPLITGRAVHLSPTLIIIATPVGLALYGPIGALIAIPGTAALQVVTCTVLLPALRRCQEADG